MTQEVGGRWTLSPCRRWTGSRGTTTPVLAPRSGRGGTGAVENSATNIVLITIDDRGKSRYTVLPVYRIPDCGSV